MSVEMWCKISCPNCKENNWASEGDPMDYSGVDTEAVECWKCDHRFWIDDSLAEDYTYDLEDEDCKFTSVEEMLNEGCVLVTRGRKSPDDPAEPLKGHQNI